MPAGTRIVPHIGEVNLNAETYDHPHEFRPERFLDASPPTYAWIPFGGGIKRCLGASFSLLELTVVLQTLLRSRQLRSRAQTIRTARSAAESCCFRTAGFLSAITPIDG